MEKTILVGSPNINGNIGSCEIKSNTFSIDSWNNRTVSVNSCTGEVVSDSTYYDWSIVYFPGIIVGIILIFAFALKVISD